MATASWKARGRIGNTERLDNTEHQSGGHRGQAVAEPAQNGNGESLDGQPGAVVILGVGDGAHDRSGQGADAG